jgi:hypothetical protein
LQPARPTADDATVHPAVVALSLDEKGFVLGATLAHLDAGAAAAQLGGDAGARCAAALGALAEEPKAVRVGSIAELIALVRAPVPAGIELVHEGWLRARLVHQTAATIRAVTAPLPDPIRAIAEEILRARGDEPDDPDLLCDADGLADLQRAVFGGLVPLTGPGGPRGMARELVMLAPAALDETIARHGAEVMGASLRGAPAAVLARAAAALDDRLAPSLLDAAARTGTPAERDEARAAVAEAGGGTSPTAIHDACFNLGLPRVARLLADDEGAVLAVAQRLAPETGRRLLDAAGIAAPWVA